MPSKHSELNPFETLKMLHRLLRSWRLFLCFYATAFSLSSIPHPILPYILNHKGAQQMTTKDQVSTIASNSGCRRPGEGFHRDSTCCRELLPVLVSRVTLQCQQNSMGSMLYQSNFQISLTMDRAKFLQKESSSLPCIPTTEQCSMECSWQCSLERRGRDQVCLPMSWHEQGSLVNRFSSIISKATRDF